MRWWPLLMWISLLCAGSGCASRHFAIESPDDFIELDEGRQRELGYALRSLSAYGVVLGVREIDNDRHGSREFWVDAIRNRLRRTGAYALLEESDVRASTGEDGHQMRFGRDQDGHPYRYWVTVFVTHERIYVIEAGGREERFAEAQALVEQAVTSFAVR
jgi:hypothetical protein